MEGDEKEEEEEESLWEEEEEEEEEDKPEPFCAKFISCRVTKGKVCSRRRRRRREEEEEEEEEESLFRVAGCLGGRRSERFN